MTGSSLTNFIAFEKHRLKLLKHKADLKIKYLKKEIDGSNYKIALGKTNVSLKETLEGQRTQLKQGGVKENLIYYYCKNCKIYFYIIRGMLYGKDKICPLCGAGKKDKLLRTNENVLIHQWIFEKEKKSKDIEEGEEKITEDIEKIEEEIAEEFEKEEEKSINLKVPSLKWSDAGACGLTCVRMILKYFDKEIPEPKDEAVKKYINGFGSNLKEEAKLAYILLKAFESKDQDYLKSIKYLIYDEGTKLFQSNARGLVKKWILTNENKLIREYALEYKLPLELQLILSILIGKEIIREEPTFEELTILKIREYLTNTKKKNELPLLLMDGNHFLVLNGINKNTLIFNDPRGREVTYSFEELKKKAEDAASKASPTTTKKMTKSALAIYRLKIEKKKIKVVEKLLEEIKKKEISETPSEKITEKEILKKDGLKELLPLHLRLATSKDEDFRLPLFSFNKLNEIQREAEFKKSVKEWRNSNEELYEKGFYEDSNKHIWVLLKEFPTKESFGRAEKIFQEINKEGGIAIYFKKPKFRQKFKPKIFLKYSKFHSIHTQYNKKTLSKLIKEKTKDHEKFTEFLIADEDIINALIRAAGLKEEYYVITDFIKTHLGTRKVLWLRSKQ